MIDKITGAKKYLIIAKDTMLSYFKAQLLIMLILCVLYSCALLIAGVKYAVLLGIISGMLSFVPYLGFAVGMVVSIIVAVVQYVDFWHPLFVVIGFLVVQVLESVIITPKVMGKSLGIHPVVAIILIIAAGFSTGPIGVVITLPLAAVIFKIYKDIMAKTPEENTEK